MPASQEKKENLESSEAESIEISEEPPIDYIGYENIVPIKERTATKLAYFLVGGFLSLLFLPFLYLIIMVFVTNGNTSSLTIVFAQSMDLLKTVAAVLGGLVGSVLTYYFATQDRR